MLFFSRHDRRSASDEDTHWRDSSRERSDRKHSDSGGEHREVSMEKYPDEHHEETAPPKPAEAEEKMTE